MKIALLLFTIFPFLSSAQNLANAISVSVGAEYHNLNTHAWDAEVTYNRRFGKSNRFWSEFGVNYSILEYKGDSGITLDTNNNQPAFGSIYYPSYIRREAIHYSRTSALRLQAGINYTLIDEEKFRLSTGLNFVNQLLMRQREHGQRVYIPTEGADTLSVVYYNYFSEQNFASTANAITVILQPHVDVAIQLTDKLWFTSRIAYYWKVLPTVRHSRAQLNLGVRYEW